MEPDPQRERETPSDRRDWSPYDEAAAQEDAEWRRGRRRRWLAILGVASLLLCLTGSAVGYILYDRATRIDRSTPAVVVLQYVNTVFDERDFESAEVFECDSSDAQRSLRSLLEQLEEVERRFDIRVTVSTSTFATDITGSDAVVRTHLLIDVPEKDGRPSRDNQAWVFRLRDEDGWRVCKAERES